MPWAALLHRSGIAAALLLGDDDGGTGSPSALSDAAAVARGNVLIDTIERELIPAGQRDEELQVDPSDPEFTPRSTISKLRSAAWSPTSTWRSRRTPSSTSSGAA